MILADAAALACALVDDGADGALARQRLAAATAVLVAEGIDQQVSTLLGRLVDTGRLSEQRAEQAIADLADLPLERVPTWPFLEAAWQLREACGTRSADVVVAQGGPGGIMDSRGEGRLPIVVPRDPALGEHVDDHQLRFAAHLHRRGRVALALDEQAFRSAVLHALAAPHEFAVSPEAAPTPATAVAVAAALDAVLARRAARPGRRLRFRFPGRAPARG